MTSLRRLFILVPSAATTSPIKGAAALANALSRKLPVTFVSLRPVKDGFHFLDDKVDRVSLETARTWPGRLFVLRRWLRQAGKRSSLASISYCLSADFFNAYCRDLAVTCSSVRGNLPKVYVQTYGSPGRWIADRHLRLLRRLDHVVSMTVAMATQVQQYTGKPSPVIGNFVDEGALDKFRHTVASSGPLRFVYTGSMLHGKQPQALLDAVRTLQERGVTLRLDAYGDGPLLPSLRAQVRALPDPEAVQFHGHVSEPYAAVAAADTLVLPSLAEGLSRSAIEALFLGVPCVLRDADGNAELVSDNVNGGLFRHEHELADVMVRTAQWSRRENPERSCLLPPQFRQDLAAEKFLELIEQGGFARGAQDRAQALGNCA